MTLSEIITYLDGTAQTVAALGIPEASAGAAIADGLLKVIQSALNAHNAVTGKPLDLNLLQPIDKV
jgi:hypothetical protein